MKKETRVIASFETSMTACRKIVHLWKNKNSYVVRIFGEEESEQYFDSYTKAFDYMIANIQMMK